MMKKSKTQVNKHFAKAVFPAVLFSLYVLLDYFNVPQMLGVSSKRINVAFFDVFLNAAIVVVLYIITYYLIDRRQIQKDTNAKGIVDFLLLYTYKECLDNLNMVWNPVWLREYIIPKVDGNKPVNQNRVVSNIQNLPFASQSEVLELARGGYLEKEVLEKYLHIQKEYKHIVAMKIVFFDMTNPQTAEQQALFMDINHRSDELMSLLSEEIKRLELVS